jgi:hypothetical protein
MMPRGSRAASSPRLCARSSCRLDGAGQPPRGAARWAGWWGRSGEDRDGVGVGREVIKKDVWARDEGEI